MQDQDFKKMAYEPITEAWKIIHMTQHLGPDDTEKWEEFVKAHDDFCEKYDYGSNKSYGYYLGMAIMAVVDEIAKENLRE